mmetsp:Transcript_13721/g.19974  ORF Transcript_13721/g.19974 Transcript_13721/m.19974 type:complete len:81 (-) Transcript_13721:991-1233(-)
MDGQVHPLSTRASSLNSCIVSQLFHSRSSASTLNSSIHSQLQHLKNLVKGPHPQVHALSTTTVLGFYQVQQCSGARMIGL